MGFLLAAVACSVAIATLFKAAERRNVDRVAVLAVNYVAALVVALVVAPPGSLRPDAGLVGLGVLTGALFIAGFYLFSVAIRAAGMGLATAVMRLSVVVPVLASWAIWGERPSLGQTLGLLVAGGAFVLLAGRMGGVQQDSGASSGLVLGLLFVAGGLVDTSLKAFSAAYGTRYPEAVFLLFVFGVAALLGGLGVVWKGGRTGRWPRPEALGWGVLVGLVNYGSAAFLLRALAVLPGPLVFPVNNVSVVAGAALVGWLMWQERLSPRQLGGLALAGVALVLLWQ